MSSYATTGVQVTVAVMRRPPAGSRGRGVRKRAGRSSCGVWPEPSTMASRAPGIPAATDSARGRRAIVEGAGDDERRGADLAEAIREGLHHALAGAAEAGREPVGAVGEPDRADPRGAGRGQGGLGREDRLGLPLGDERGDAVALDPVGEGARPRPVVRSRATWSAMPARGALEDEPADDVGMRDGEAERDPGAERVADDVGGRGAERGEGSRPGRRPSARRSCGSRRRCVGAAVARQVHDDRPGTSARTPWHDPPTTCRGP